MPADVQPYGLGAAMQIETQRLILREFREDDAAAVLAYWNDPLYQRYYPEIDDRPAVVRELITMFVASQSEEPRRVWQLALTEKRGGRLIGNCGLRVNNPESGEGNIGYELDPAFWGHGYATEAATAIVRFGFDGLRLHRIWAECVADNTGSSRVLEKLGMRREAHFREHQYYRRRWWDTLIYAVLAHEWRDPAEQSPPNAISDGC